MRSDEGKRSSRVATVTAVGVVARHAVDKDLPSSKPLLQSSAAAEQVPEARDG